MNFRSLTFAAALAYPLTLLLYGCASFGVFTPATPEGCREGAVVHPERSDESIECHPTATKLIVVTEGWAMHICQCP